MAQVDKEVRAIRDKIFELARKSPDLETMHWYIALDDCFENDEFSPSELSSIKWRGTVLAPEGEPVAKLLWMIDALVRSRGYDLNKVTIGLESMRPR